MISGSCRTVRDRYNNEVSVTPERWEHILAALCSEIMCCFWTWEPGQYVDPGVLHIHASHAAAQQRMRQLMEQYHNTPMDLADASLVATAETRNLRRVFTLDNDFRVYRIKGTGVFEIVF